MTDDPCGDSLRDLGPDHTHAAPSAPSSGDLDAALLARYLHEDPALCRKQSPHGHPRWMQKPLCVSVADRLAARLASQQESGK